METSELQQLVGSDAEGENDDSLAPEDTINEVKIISPTKSNKLISSSGNTSRSSVTKSAPRYGAGLLPGGARIAFVNERKPTRDQVKTATARPRNPHKAPTTTTTTTTTTGQSTPTNIRHHSFISEVPDVRHMERALLGLLADFHSGKLRAFGSGCTMEQMTNIRQQQEKLAKLHFDLGAATVPSLNEDSLRRSQNTMSQLIQRLEQLSVSIEGLHNNNGSNTNSK